MTILKINESDEKILEDTWKGWSEKSIDALSKTINKTVEVKRVKVKKVASKDFPKLLNPDQDVTNTIVSTEVFGPTLGLIIMCFPQKDILDLVSLLLHKDPGAFTGLTNENVSVVRETSNILTGYYVDSLNELFNQIFGMKNPNLSINQYRAVENSCLGNLYTKDFVILFFELDFIVPELNISGKLFLAFKDEILDELVNLSLQK